MAESEHYHKGMMQARLVSKDGSVHVTDEVFNSASHMLGAVFALLGGTLLIVLAAAQHKPWHVVGFSIYAAAMFLLFLFSSLHHGVDASPEVELRLKLMDYSAVFLLIAGTYTPICLVEVRNALGWTVLGVVWLVTLVGIALKIARPHLPKWVTNTLSLASGWMALPLLAGLWPHFGLLGLVLLFLGGLFYTGGAVIYASEKPNPLPGKFGFHEIWHVAVLLGALCHYFCMLLVVLPHA
ncbi:MAG: PAQR family membrane homeostasis protein TrhA [Candidatus Xenobia bacterium]